MSDAGTYSLVAENRNGHDSVDLDLIVLDEVHANDCDMFLNGSLECTCNNRFRAECSDQEHIKLGIQVRWVWGGFNLLLLDPLSYGIYSGLHHMARGLERHS
jgi:hypothetical protein